MRPNAPEKENCAKQRSRCPILPRFSRPMSLLVNHMVSAVPAEAAILAALSFASGNGTGGARLRVGRAVE